MGATPFYVPLLTNPDADYTFLVVPFETPFEDEDADEDADEDSDEDEDEDET